MGTPEVFMVLLVILSYGAVILLVAYVLRIVFKVRQFEKHQLAQTKLLSEIAKAQGVDEGVINAVNSSLD